MRIGIDVGGTNTDAALLDGMTVKGACKTPTTADVSSGITAVLKEVLRMTGVAASPIQAVMIGTTHFTNAVVERKRLLEVAAIRLGLPATRALPPMTDWPNDLATTLGRHTFMVHGGHEFDGREIALTHRSMAILTELGVRDRLDPADISDLRQAQVTNGAAPHALQFEPQDRSGGRLGVLVPNHRIREALYRLTVDQPDVDIRAGRRIVQARIRPGTPRKPGGAALPLDDGPALTAGLLVAADSRFSTVRTQLGVGADLHPQGCSMIVCRVRHDRDHDHAHQIHLKLKKFNIIYRNIYGIYHHGHHHDCRLVVHHLLDLDDFEIHHELN